MPHARRKATNDEPATTARGREHRARGFTLVEVMVTVAVAGILFATAVHALTGSNESLMEIRRAKAKSALLEAALRQESYFMNHKRYAETVGEGGLNLASTTDGGHYLIQVAPADEECGINSCYTLRAVSRDRQPDDDCRMLLLTSHGARLPARCW